MREHPKSGRNDCRYVPGVEALEDRTVPAGNVQVAVIGGTLNLSGTGGPDQVSVTGSGDHAAVIRSLDGATTINGRTGPLYVSGFGDTYIHLGDGNNTISVTGIGGEGLYVNLGNGNNTFTDDHAVNGGVTFVDAGAGLNTITISNALFAQPVAVRTAGGNNQINATNVEVINFAVTANGGTDFFNPQGGTIVLPRLVGSVTNGSRPTAAPTVTLSTSATSPTNASPLLFTASFSAAVTGFGITGVQATNGTVTAVTATDPQTYSIQVTPTGQGAVTVTVPAGAASDVNGNLNAASNTVSVTYDSIAPSVTVTPQTTNSTLPTIGGTVSDPTATVNVTVNGQTYAATVTGTSWIAPVTTALADGTYPVTATATDPAGNSTTSAPANLVIDTVTPATPTLDLTPASDSGIVGDLRTDDSTVALTGTTKAGATVNLYTATAGTAPGTGSVVATTTAGADGTFTFNNVALAAGPNSFVVKATDAAGNVSSTFAQTFTRTTPPTVPNPIATQNLSATGSAQTFDLSSVFADSEQVVRMTIAYPTGQTATLDINLFGGTQLQTTVNNFLSYVNNASASGSYNGSIFDRLVSGFVLQGGAFQFNSSTHTFPAITAQAAIASQPDVSNTIGTIAMALSGGSANTATDAFFFNLADNSSNLDLQSGGFTVFGQVMENGLQTLKTLGALNTYSGSGQPGAGPFPVGPSANTTNFPNNLTSADVVTLTTAAVLTNAQKLSFSVVSNSNAAAATASISGSTLTITPVAAGTTTITLKATNLDGSTTTTQVQVNVT
jgi:cyclophilin family peptidyl-prolyl cis-trans isomerase